MIRLPIVHDFCDESEVKNKLHTVLHSHFTGFVEFAWRHTKFTFPAPSRVPGLFCACAIVISCGLPIVVHRRSYVSKCCFTGISVTWALGPPAHSGQNLRRDAWVDLLLFSQIPVQWMRSGANAERWLYEQ